MNFFSQLYLQIARQWSKASVAGRVATIVTALLVLASVVGTAIWSSTPDYKMLREGVSPVVVGEMVSLLDARGIPNQLNYSGSGVLVPSSRWNEANIVVSEVSGMDQAPQPDRGGSQLFPEQLGFTDELRRKETELQQSIESLQGIKSANVHIAMSKPSPFRKNQHPTSASVIIEAGPGIIISKEVGATIIQIVASAVEGLEAESVTLTSADGSLVENIAKDDPAATRREFVRGIEIEKAMKAQDVLAASLGPGKAVVRVSAVLDSYLEKTITHNKILADEKVRLTESLTTKDEKGGSSQTGPATGASSNGGPGNLGTTTSPTRSSKEETNTTTYDYPRIVETSREVGGTLTKLSISATVDVTREEDDGNGNVTSVTVLTQDQVENLIKSAVEFDQARGDQIQVVLAEISDPTDQAKIPDSQQWEFVGQLARHASLGLAAVVALLIGVMTINKLKPIEVAREDDQRKNELLNDLARRVDRNPEAVSKILAAWLTQESGEDGDEDTTAKAA